MISPIFSLVYVQLPDNTYRFFPLAETKDDMAQTLSTMPDNYTIAIWPMQSTQAFGTADSARSNFTQRARSKFMRLADAKILDERQAVKLNTKNAFRTYSELSEKLHKANMDHKYLQFLASHSPKNIHYAQQQADSEAKIRDLGTAHRGAFNMWRLAKSLPMKRKIDIPIEFSEKYVDFKTNEYFNLDDIVDLFISVTRISRKKSDKQIAAYLKWLETPAEPAKVDTKMDPIETEGKMDTIQSAEHIDMDFPTMVVG